MDPHPCRGLVMNVPEFFADPAFRRWLASKLPKFAEWSAVVVLVDPSLSGAGSDSDMPERFWTRIIDACREHLGVGSPQHSHYIVRLTNVADR